MTETLPAVVNGRDEAAIIERVLMVGDLARLEPAERVSYYNALCHSLKLNPLSRPFEYVEFPIGDGKKQLQLYARKDCAEQLRRIHRVSITNLSTQHDDELYIVTATASTPDGRTDMDRGVVAIQNLRGQMLANGMMKAVTKAKRRVTLSLCGLGIVDETELETIPGARTIRVDEETGVILDQPAPAALPAPEIQPPPRPAAAPKPGPSERDRAKLEYGKAAYSAQQAGVKAPPIARDATAEEIRAAILVIEAQILDAESDRAAAAEGAA